MKAEAQKFYRSFSLYNGLLFYNRKYHLFGFELLIKKKPRSAAVIHAPPWMLQTVVSPELVGESSPFCDVQL